MGSNGRDPRSSAIKSLGLAEKPSRSSKRPSACALANVATSADARDEQHRATLTDRGAAERDGEMRLADPRRTKEKQRYAMCDPAAGRQLADLPRIERGLSGKVEAVRSRTQGK